MTDVPVDITADSAAHARDQAIAEAQRSGFEQLLGRLGADTALASKLTDDDIATLVQNFEVQNERTSSVRYIGTFTVQFRPVATRDWLAKNGATYTEARSKPILILPIYVSNGHPVLWEEHTKWWAAWESSHNASVVPIILPSGGLDDIAVLSTEEAAQGDSDAIKALSDKYQAGGAIVATLTGDLENPGAPFKVTVTRYDSDGTAGEPSSFTLPPASDKAAIDNALAQAVKQAHGMLENSWRQTVAKSTAAPAERLPVVVPIDTLEEWAQIRSKLNKIRAIEKTDVVTLARGTTNIELEFHGGIDQLQEQLEQQNLTLTQDSSNGSWILQQATAEAPLWL